MQQRIPLLLLTPLQLTLLGLSFPLLALASLLLTFLLLESLETKLCLLLPLPPLLLFQFLPLLSLSALAVCESRLDGLLRLLGLGGTDGHEGLPARHDSRFLLGYGSKSL